MPVRQEGAEAQGDLGQPAVQGPRSNTAEEEMATRALMTEWKTLFRCMRLKLDVFSFLI